MIEVPLPNYLDLHFYKYDHQKVKENKVGVLKVEIPYNF